MLSQLVLGYLWVAGLVLIMQHGYVGGVPTKSAYQTLKLKQQRQKEKTKSTQDEMMRRRKYEAERHSLEKQQRRRANEEMAFYDPPLLQSSEVPLVVNDDRILFVGHRNVLYGSLYPYGFINLMEQQFKRSGLRNITLRALGTTSDASHLLDTAFLSNFYLRDKSDFEIQFPTKTVFLVGNEIFDPLLTEGEAGLVTVRQNVERIVATLVRERIPVVLGTLFVSGEKYDSSNPNDPFFEDWQGILRRISTTYDNVSYIDFSQPMQKYWEAKNLDNVDHSILTHDGEVFNEEGHAFIACQLLQAFKLMDKPLIDDVASTDLIAHMDMLANSSKRMLDIESSSRLIYNSPLWDKLVDSEAVKQRRRDMEEVWLN